MPITPEQDRNLIRDLGPAAGGAQVKSGNAFGNNPGYAYTVGASFYGGPSDSSTHGDTGYRGDHLTGKMAFAELGMGTAMGNLPYKTQLVITYNGKQVIAEKLDIGAGGSKVQGHPRVIDLWYQTAQQLGFDGTGLVYIERVDGKPIGGSVGKPTRTGTDFLSQVAGAPANAVSAATSGLGEIAKILSYIFSLQFLYIIGGGALLIVGLVMLLRTTQAGRTVTDLPTKVLPIE